MKEFNSQEKMLGIGLTFGVVFGVLTDNVGLGICLGLAVSAGVGKYLKKK